MEGKKKKGFIWDQQKVKFRVHIHGESHASSQQKNREENSFIERKGKLRGGLQ